MRSLAGRNPLPTVMPNSSVAMQLADANEREYLPEVLVTTFIDPISPPGSYQRQKRSDVLLVVGGIGRAVPVKFGLEEALAMYHSAAP